MEDIKINQDSYEHNGKTIPFTELDQLFGQVYHGEENLIHYLHKYDTKPKLGINPDCILISLDEKDKGLVVKYEELRDPRYFKSIPQE